MARPDLPVGIPLTYSQEYRRCHKHGCTRCRTGPGHGPYWFARWTQNGRPHKRYLGRHLPPDVPHGPAQPSVSSPLPRLRVQTLGGLRVWRAGQPIPASAWTRRRAGALLTCLLAAPRLRLGRDVAAALLWPEHAPEAARRALRQSLHQLRRLLDDIPAGGASSAVPDEGGVLTLAIRAQAPSDGALLPPEAWLDAVAFRRAATAALAGDDPVAAQAALALYTGDYLPDDAALDADWEEPWITRERRVLRELRIRLLLHLAGLSAAAGAPTVAEEHLRLVLQLDPAHEDAATRLMGLLAEAGQRGEALRTYQALAGALEQELGASPSAEVEALRARLVRQERAPASADVSRRAARLPPGNLPAALSSFVGRVWELQEVHRLLGTTRLLTLTGAPGCGKTRLALSAASALPAAYPDGVWLVELAAVADPALVPGAVATTLGIREEQDGSLSETLPAALAPRRLLLLLDNCEHVRAACAALAASLLAACPGVRLLATSRTPLGAAGETVWVTPPLAVPPETVTDPADITHYEAVQLFVARAEATGAARVREAPAAGAVAALCRRLDGLPLAIELAAGWSPLLAPAALLAHLDPCLPLLTRGPRSLPPRQQTLRGALAWSYHLVSPAQQRLFARLGVFVGGWTLDEAWTAWAANAPAAGPALLEDLAALVDHHLVRTVDTESGDRRLTMLETIRDFAQERLEALGDEDQAAEAHTRYVLHLAEVAARVFRRPDQEAVLTRLEHEQGNLRAALERLLAAGDRDRSLRLAEGLWRFWYVRGHLAEGRAWLDRVLALQGDPLADPPERARRQAEVLDGAGILAWSQGDAARARRLYEAALALYAAAGDAAGRDSVLSDLGLLFVEQREYARATALYEEVVQGTMARGDTALTAEALMNLGHIALEQGDDGRAAALYGHAAARYRTVRNTRGVAHSLSNLGRVRAAQGEAAEAMALYREALLLMRGLGDTQGVAECLDGLAWSTGACGQVRHAVVLCGAAAGLRNRIGTALSPWERGPVEETLARARAGLDEATVAAAWAEGQGLTLEQAGALALDAPG